MVRKLAERLLPPEIAGRRKQGLAYLGASWFEPPANQRLRQLLLDSADRGVFERRLLYIKSGADILETQTHVNMEILRSFTAAGLS